MSVCATGLCLRGQPFVLHSATVYGGLDDPAGLIQSAGEAHLNTLEIVEFEYVWRDLAETMSERTWTRVDRLISQAAAANLHVLLNLSSYHHSLVRAGIQPTTYDWTPYLTFVARRVNTVTGVRYSDDPTIAMVEMVGEIDAPNYTAPLRGTTAELTAFFRTVLQTWKGLDANHVVNTGGFSYLNDPNSGIDWKTIMADPNDDACAFEIYSFPDETVTAAGVTQYCKGLGKPWFLAAWSSCLGPSGGSWDDSHLADDAAMAAHAQHMYDLAHGTAPAAYRSIGTSFWNLGPETTSPTCDINSGFPQTLAVVIANAP